MKKMYLFILLFLVVLTTFAQPKFNANNCFTLNASSNLGFAVVNQNLDDFKKKTGENYIWDFTNAGSPGPWTSWTNPTVPYKMQPSTQSIHNLFYNSQINEYASVAFARDHFYTYSANKDTLYFDGYYGSLNYLYFPRIPYLTFPLSYNDSVFTYTKQYDTQNPTGNAIGSVSRYWIYDGYGTLKLPYGTDKDVYRIRTKQIDSSYVINMSAQYEEIIWFNATDGIPVLRFQKNGTLIAAYYASANGTTGFDQNLISDNVNIYPNPFSDVINVSNFSSKKLIKFSLYDNLGKLVVSERDLINNIIDTQYLKNGLYLLEIEFNDHSTIRKKMIK